MIKEDAIPANNISSGGIAGTPPDQPGVPKKRLKVILNNAKMLTRKK